MWKYFALFLLGASGGQAELSLNKISKNLHEEMNSVLDTAYVNYSTPIVNTTYVSKQEFDMRAMGHLYNSTKLIIDVIAQKQAYPEGFVSVSDGNIEIASPRDEWKTLLAHYAGPTAIVVVALLLVIILPFTGLCWCCCYWCRSRRRRPFDRKYDACLKGLLAIILIALLTLFLFGVVCAFATEEQLEEGFEKAPHTVRDGIKDVREYLNATQAHARWLLVVNYAELETKLNAMLTNGGKTVSVKLGEFSHAVSVTTLNQMVQRLDFVQRDLRLVHNVTSSLRYNAERLNAGLSKVRGELLNTLADCHQPQCAKLQEKYKIGELASDIRYNHLPDVTDLLNNVTQLLESNIKAEVAQGQKVFNDIQRGIQRSVDEHVPRVQDTITRTGEKLRAVADQITAACGNASQLLQQQAVVADTMEDLRHQYLPYRRYVALGVASALLLVVVLLAWGLTCGVCGKRPDVYGASDCCNKGAGSTALLCGMGLIFIVGAVVSLSMVVYFLLGVAGQRFVCDPLTEPQGNRLFEDLEKFVDLEKLVFNKHEDPDFNMTAVLQRCHRNQTIYMVLSLQRVLDLDELRAQLAGEVSARAHSLRVGAPPGTGHFSILRSSAKEKLRMLAGTGLSEFDFDRILNALETNITNLSLDGLAAQLESTAQALGPRAGFMRVSMQLRDAAAMLRAYHADPVQIIADQTRQLNETAIKLRDGLRYNQMPLKEAISDLLRETEEAEVFLNTQGPDLIQNMTREFATVVASLLDEYLARVVDAGHHTVGKCAPVSAAYNTTRDALCVNVLMPLNGGWIALAWCILLLAPLLMAAGRLARLYRTLDPYPGPLVEAAYKAEKRSGRAAAAAPRAESSRPVEHARRYNDMAPKHWEEGPPRYHAPTEYERPPPYYYPPSNDRQ